MKRIVLAYSGGLASAVALRWLGQQSDAEIVTVTLDLGQGPDLAVVREQALALGAVRAHVIDAREQFAGSFILPALQAGAFSVDVASSVAIARALVAGRLVDLARMESARAVAHASTRDSVTGRLLDTLLGTLDPALEVIVPARAANLSDDEMVGYARAAGIHVPPPAPTWVDANLWTRTIGVPPGIELDEEAYLLTRAAAEAPDSPASLDLEFAAGMPVRTNGVEMSFTELIESVETIAGAHGIGRSRGSDGLSILEAPAAAVLATAHAALESVTLGSDVAGMKRAMGVAYVHHLNEGRWFAPPKAAIDAFVAIVQQRVTGTVRLRLHKGECHVVECRSPHHVGPAARSPKVVA